MIRHAHTSQIWTIEGFLSPHECDSLMLLSERKGYEEATVSLPEGAKMIKGLRDNYRVNITDPELAETLFENLKPHLPELDDKLPATALYEDFRFYRYDKSQRFKRHIDGRVTDGDKESRLTFMIYLNDNFSGGETRFNDVEIKPQKGTALIFIHELKHESLPIDDGTKYVLRSDIFYEKAP